MSRLFDDVNNYFNVKRCAASLALYCAIAILLFNCLVSTPALAETSRNFTSFNYDAAGNLISVESEISDTPPVVESINPLTYRADSRAAVQVNGSALRSMSITTDSGEITVVDIVSSENTLNFDLLLTGNVDQV